MRGGAGAANHGETEWLLQLASESNLIRGVVGWAPIASTEFAGVLEKWTRSRKIERAAAHHSG